MEITPEFIIAVEHGAESLECQSRSLDHADIAKDDTTAGRVVRQGAEKYRQMADMLNGWAKRARRDAGMESRDLC